MGWEEVVWEEGRGFHGEVNRLLAGGEKWACFEKKRKRNRGKFPCMLFETRLLSCWHSSENVI